MEKAEKPKIPVLILSTHTEDQYAIRTIRAGASGYLNKKTLSDNLIEAIRAVQGGEKYISPSLAQLLAERVAGDTVALPHECLTDREFQVLCMIASGKTVSDIAKELFLSVKPISTYRKNILEKMDLKNNAEITHYVMKRISLTCK